MLDKDDSFRSTKADQSRIEFWKKKPTLWKMFNSEENRTLWSFLRPRWSILFILTVLSFCLASMEGAKALVLVGLIKGLVASEAELQGLLSFSIFGRSFGFDSIINLAGDRIGIISILFAILLILTLLSAKIKLANT